MKWLTLFLALPLAAGVRIYVTNSAGDNVSTLWAVLSNVFPLC